MRADKSEQALTTPPTRMRGGMEKKVLKYRQQKSKQAQLESFISEKRRNIEKMMQEQPVIEPEEELDLQKFASDIDLKHRRYLQDMSALEDTRLAIIEARGSLEGLQLELSLQEETLSSLKKTSTREVASQEEMAAQLRNRLAEERAERARMEEERCQRQLDHVQKLTNQKEELIGRTEEMLKKRKALDLALKKLKDHFEEDYKAQREVWAKAEAERREKWQQRKLQQITENTLKGLEPQINRIVASSKREISKIQQNYESLRNEYTRQMNEQFQANLRQIKLQITRRSDEESALMIDKASEQHRKQLQKLISSYQAEKAQLKCGKEAEMRQLQGRRKRQAQQFMNRNKDYVVTHLNEVMQIKTNYQNEIRALDGSLGKMLEKEQNEIKAKYERKIKACTEQQQQKFKSRTKAFFEQQVKQSDSLYEDLVEKVAVQNEAIESQLKKQTQGQLRQFKESHQGQLKSIRKQLQVLMGKQRQEEEALLGVKQVREGIQSEHDGLMRENQYLKKKQMEFQAEVIKLKAKEADFLEKDTQQTNSIEAQWQEQLSLLEKKISQVDAQMQAQQRIMEEKQEEERNKIRAVMTKLEKEGLQLMTKLKEDVQRARREKAMKVALSGKLAQMRKKLKDMQAKRRQ